MQLFDICKVEQYVGKHCLYKLYCSDNTYIEIYVMDIRDGIMKYKDERGTVNYCDCKDFEGRVFIISPFTNNKKDSEYNINDIVDISMPNSNCDVANGSICIHEWDHCVLTSYPPIYQRKCKKCGIIQHSKCIALNEDYWKDGPY